MALSSAGAKALSRAFRIGIVLCSVSVTALATAAASASAQGFSVAPGSPVLTGGANPLSLDVGDFNGDGTRDVVAGNSASNNVSVLLGGGEGRLSLAGAPVLTGGAGPRSLAVGHFNGDGKLDVVVANAFSSNVSVLLGDGQGGLSLVGVPVSSGGPFAVALDVGDFNGDGKLDVATANGGGSDKVAVLLGDGQGGLGPATTFATGGSDTQDVAVGDFNGDRRLDVAAANSFSRDVSVLLGDGQGGLSVAGAPVSTGSAGAAPSSLTVGDFNGDGRLDVAVTNQMREVGGGNDVSVLLGDGQGGLSPAPGSPFDAGGTQPSSVAVGDFDGDRKLDVAVGQNQALSVLLGDGQGRLSPAPNSPYVTGGSGSRSVAVGAFNGDRRPDVAVAHSQSNDVSAMLNNLASPPAALALSPKTDTNAFGEHTVTATVTDGFGDPAQGVTVRFSVSGLNTASGSQTTDANGQASFTYMTTTRKRKGKDTILAFADTNENGVQDAGEPSDTATKNWKPR